MLHKSQQFPMPIHIVTDREYPRGTAGLPFEILLESRQKCRRGPRERFERVTVELLPTQPHQIGALLSGGGTEHGCAVSHCVRHSGPVYFMKARTVAPYRDNVFVPLREGIGDGVGKARPEPIPPLPFVGRLHDRQSAVVNGPPRVPIERLGDPSMLCIVLPYELLVLPLPRRAVAEEQDGGMDTGRVDDCKRVS